MKSKVARRILAETPEETKIFVRKYAEIVACVHDLMQQQGLTQRDLAARMAKNPSELSRWLHGEHNMTLRSLAKLEAELGEDIFLKPVRIQRSTVSQIRATEQRVIGYITQPPSWKRSMSVCSTLTGAAASPPGAGAAAS